MIHVAGCLPPTASYRPVDGWPKYAVGDDGSVWSIHSGVWVRMKLTTNNGRAVVTLRDKGKGRLFKVHTLVAVAFHGPRPDGCECRHLDGNPLNNIADNLEWGTPKQNAGDKIGHGTALRGESHPSAKINDATAKIIRELYAAGGWKQKDLAERFGIKQPHVSRIIRGERKDALRHG